MENAVWVTLKWSEMHWSQRLMRHILEKNSTRWREWSKLSDSNAQLFAHKVKWRRKRLINCLNSLTSCRKLLMDWGRHPSQYKQLNLVLMKILSDKFWKDWAILKMISWVLKMNLLDGSKKCKTSSIIKQILKLWKP